MRISFLGAAGTVTGSRFLVENGGTRLLVDCGLFQGVKALRLKDRGPFPIPPKELDAIVLTHAHIDHSGLVPALVRDGFRGPVYCTAATRALLGVLWPDAAHLQEEEARYRNKTRTTRHNPALPLYTSEDAERALEQVRAVPFEHDFVVGKKHHPLTLRYARAGHILGAASLSVSDDTRRIVFSGDLGRSDDLLMHPPAPVGPADYVVMESTYGNRDHLDGDPAELLADVVNRTAKRGGSVIIPAFAVGRSQQILLLLARLKAEQRIPDLPVFLNSPMAIDVTDIYRAHREDHRLSVEECEAMCSAARYVRSVEESKRLNDNPVPRIILAGSGMATGGRVVHHLKAMLGDHRHTVLFAGYQAAGTRGEALLSGARKVKIHGAWIDVRAEVASLDVLSGHADAEELLAWIQTASPTPRGVFLVHGEPAALEALRVRVHDAIGVDPVVPAMGDTVELDT